MVNYMKRKISSDKGNAMVVIGITLIVAVLLIGGMITDLSKAHQLKSSYIDAAQKASQIAIREQTSDGFLMPKAASKLIYEYENNTRLSIFGSGYIDNVNPVNDGVLAGCDSNDRVITVYMTRGQGVYYKGQNDIANADVNRYVVGSMRLDEARGATEEAIESALGLDNVKKLQILNGKYTSINVEINEATPNMVLPGAFAVSGGDANSMMCQTLGIKAGASQFTGLTGEYE